MSVVKQHAPLVLASGSAIRQQMLKAVGLQFSVMPSGVDEDALKVNAGDFDQLAIALACAKALAVSTQKPDAYVIGADQLCIHGTEILSKPGSYERAEVQLSRLSGNTHRQYSGVAITRGNEVIWQHSAHATLTMRSLNPAEIHSYVAADAPLSSCGAYTFEGLGRPLFASVEGDHDVVQGLPLVALLAALHARGLVTLG